MAHSQLFFSTSYAAYAAVTELFDFIEPARASIWRLRSQVAAHIAQTGVTSEEELHSEFFEPASVRYTNIKRWAVRPWSAMEDQLSRFALISLCAVFEAWISATVDLLSLAPTLKKQLQFPSHGAKGVGPALSALLSDGGSSVINASFGKSLTRHRKYSGHHLENLLICYRFFKECRNMIAHEGALADKKTVDAYTALSALTAADLGLKRVPPTVQPQLGKAVALPLAGTLGLSDVVLRLIVTLDARMAASTASEAYLVDKWIVAHGTKKIFHGFKTERHQNFASDLRRLNLPKAEALGALGLFLKSKAVLDWKG